MSLLAIAVRIFIYTTWGDVFVEEIGLTTKTIAKAEIVVSMFYVDLNSIYQGFP